MADFANAYPELRVEFDLTDRMVNVIEEGYDIVIRIARPADSSLVVRRIARCERVLCATPGYLNRYGRPTTPRDLDRHNCIEYEYLSEQGWAFHDGESTTRIMPTGRVRVNAGWAMRALALSGVGIALLPRFLVEADLAEDRLETVLEGVLDADIDVMAILPARRQISAKVRSFLDYGVAQLSKAPWARRIAEPEPTADRPSSDDD